MNTTAARTEIAGLPGDGRIFCVSYHPAEFPGSNSRSIVSKDQEPVLYRSGNLTADGRRLAYA
jgi:hypothetical protein